VTDFEGRFERLERRVEQLETLLRQVLARMPGAPRVDAVIEEVYRDLAQAPCRLLVATLDDVLAVEERPNMPGTIDEWPNWSMALPVPLEELEQRPLAARVAHLLRRGEDG